MIREIGHARVCYEGDGGSGGISNFFSNLFGGSAQTAPMTAALSPLSIGELSPQQLSGLESGGGAASGFDLPISGGATGAPGLDIPLTGAVQPSAVTPNAVTASSPTINSALTTQGPGPGAGAIAAPGGGGVAAPASINPDDASRGIVVGGSQPQNGFTNAVATNTPGVLDPKTIGGSAGAGTGTTVDTALDDPSFANIKKALGANANILLPAAGLGYQALTAAKAPEGLDAIRAAASQTSTQSQLLQNYLSTGTLPPGLQAGLDQAKEAAKASIRARYANLPGSSSAMEAELTNADQTAAAQGGQLAIQLFSQGMSESQVSNQLYEAILQQSLERDKELSGAVGNFATALAGGGPSVKLSLG